MGQPAHAAEARDERKTKYEAASASRNRGDFAALKVRYEGEVERYCICHKSNDEHQQYIQCEDECNWYHPQCIGFG